MRMTIASDCCTKTCNKCHKTHTTTTPDEMLEFFELYKPAADRLHSYCRPCMLTARRESYQRKKAAGGGVFRLPSPVEKVVRRRLSDWAARADKDLLAHRGTGGDQ